MAAIATASVEFTGVEASAAVTWADVGNSSPAVMVGVEVPSGGSIPLVSLQSVSGTGCTVVPSGLFTGRVNLLVIG